MRTTGTFASDFARALTDVFDAASGATHHADGALQPVAGGDAVPCHALVLLARCPKLHSALVETGGRAPLRVDCEREALLDLLGFMYLDALPSSAPHRLLRLRPVAQRWELAELDRACAEEIIARHLADEPEQVCNVLREIAREEAQARIEGAQPTAACAALRRACGDRAASTGLDVLATACGDSFRSLPFAQQVWLFSRCQDGVALHAFAAGEGACVGDRGTEGDHGGSEGLLHALLAPPHSYAIDEVATSGAYCGKT